MSVLCGWKINYLKLKILISQIRYHLFTDVMTSQSRKSVKLLVKKGTLLPQTCQRIPHSLGGLFSHTLRCLKAKRDGWTGLVWSGSYEELLVVTRLGHRSVFRHWSIRRLWNYRILVYKSVAISVHARTHTRTHTYTYIHTHTNSFCVSLFFWK